MVTSKTPEWPLSGFSLRTYIKRYNNSLLFNSNTKKPRAKSRGVCAGESHASKTSIRSPGGTTKRERSSRCPSLPMSFRIHEERPTGI
ncbi:PREDICTED: uncharacterized protein LOC105569782 isoform X2 [Vollenhovia emeryi]|uniref:uncharacterized protein LOC105569782 isoform X2 n=1 Tax=Vollenhovia emeryi TaxID=411798 RepID=UPI0005F56767|nr:PREDICTED: uncharacterized protein LOC105569782 isoform X2 [Vollenhovia emeryi]